MPLLSEFDDGDARTWEEILSDCQDDPRYAAEMPIMRDDQS